MTGELRLTMDSEAAALGRLQESLDEFAEEQQWPAPLLFRIQLALEELARNVIDHGYGEGGHQFHIMVCSLPDSVTVEITDEARPFNPLEDSPEPDLDLSLEDRMIGGVGVHLVRNFADELRYERVDGKNHLTMVKRREEGK